jgi:hypothetical protein
MLSHNITISLQSREGSRNASAIMGMVVFWYRSPLAHYVYFIFEPTGLNADLKVSFDNGATSRRANHASPAS